MRNALRLIQVGLFQRQPVPASSDVERNVLTRVLCKQNINWPGDRPVLDFKTDRHMGAMAKQRPDILASVVWEFSKTDDTKTVLQNFRDEGQEYLCSLIGKFHSPCSEVA